MSETEKQEIVFLGKCPNCDDGKFGVKTNFTS